MVFSFQVWASCKQASVEEADKKNDLVPLTISSNSRLHSPPRNKALAVIGRDWSLLSTAILRQTEKTRQHEAFRPRTARPRILFLNEHRGVMVYLLQ